MENFAERLISWQKKHGRHHLPWQRNKTPYRVWVSEIMLQQTQVETAIPYYEAFMQRFPNCRSLASADIGEVLALWSGLGYYRRAHNLHKASLIIVEKFSGELPFDIKDLQSLPGIGRSTAHAIASIAFNRSFAILDGNVKRILARYYAIQDPVDSGACEKKLWLLAQELMPENDCQTYTQAIMDLGAQICMRSPMCHLCPLALSCQAKAKQLTQVLPKKKPKKAKKIIYYHCILSIWEEKIWLEKRSSDSIWPSLWCPPMLVIDEENRLPFQYEKLATFTHSLTHIDMHITPIVTSTPHESVRGKWVAMKNLNQLGMPRAITKIFQKHSLA